MVCAGGGIGEAFFLMGGCGCLVFSVKSGWYVEDGSVWVWFVCVRVTLGKHYLYVCFTGAEMDPCGGDLRDAASDR